MTTLSPLSAAASAPVFAPPSPVSKTSRRLRPPSTPGKSSVLSEAYDRFCRLREQGQEVDPGDFCAHFPGVQSSLMRLIDAHCFLEENSHLVDETETEFPSLGSSFAGFQLERELGRGAFARAFLATEPALGYRRVVVKVSCQGGAAEAATLGRINHPNIVPVHSVRQESTTGLFVVCMPYLGSATLNHVLDRIGATPARPKSACVILDAVQERDGEWPEGPAILRRGTYSDGVRWFGAQLADALAFLHARGICHRDLKPSNVLVRPDGVPMLLDFNLSADVLQPDGQIGGTPLYMSPEQLAAMESRETAQLDHRSDLFSLGVMLYEMLTGRHPFGSLPPQREGMRVHIRERQQAGARPVRELAPHVDPGLARIVEQCLSVDPNQRPASAASLAASLRRGLSSVHRAARWLMRHPIAVAVSFIALGSGVGVAAYTISQQPPRHMALLAQGTQAFSEGNLEGALFYLNQSLQAEPRQADALFTRGRVYQKMGARDSLYYASARSDFDAADKLQKNPRNLAARAYCLYLEGQPPLTVCHQFMNAREQGFDTAAVVNNIGALSLLCLPRFEKMSLDQKPVLKTPQEKLEEVIADLEAAIEASPKLTAAYHNLGRAYLKKAELRTSKTEKKDILAALKNGVSYLEKALRLEAAPDRAFDAAILCGAAADYDDDYADQALAHLTTALSLGYAPARPLGQETYFKALLENSDFQTLAVRPLSQMPTPRRYAFVVDPIAE